MPALWSWLGDGASRARALTAAFAFRSPHYACPEVIRVSSHHSGPCLWEGADSLADPALAKPPGPASAASANRSALRRGRNTTAARRTCGAAV